MKEYSLYRHIAPDGRIYIGITSQIPSVRWQSGHGYKGNTYFTRAILKYGWENFTHEVLFEGLTENQAKELEIVMIELFESNIRSKGFNISRGGESKSGTTISEKQKQIIRAANIGKTVSKETRDKLRLRSLATWKKPSHVEHMRKINTGANNPQFGRKRSDEEKLIRGAKRIVQKNMDGSFVSEYVSIHEASEKTGVCRDVISKCCRGIYAQGRGYLWEYKKK